MSRRARARQQRRQQRRTLASGLELFGEGNPFAGQGFGSNEEAFEQVGQRRAEGRRRVEERRQQSQQFFDETVTPAVFGLGGAALGFGLGLFGGARGSAAFYGAIGGAVGYLGKRYGVL